MFIDINRYFASKARSLGYTVVSVDENLTSQMCPCCGEKVEAISMRVKYCRSCHKYFHRDVMAGQNMANVARSECLGEGRPAYLKKPPDKRQLSDDDGKGTPKLSKKRCDTVHPSYFADPSA